MVALKRLGWGLAGIGLLILILFASMIRIHVEGPPRVQQQLAAAPTVIAEPVTPPIVATGSLVIPVANVLPRQLTDTWGQSRGGGSREHHAIDIMAPLGTPVLAAASGIVEKLFESVNGGHTIYVRTTDGATIHYYAHLDTIGVTEKQQVRQGEQIATVGNTGSAAGGAPHLHFEIKTMQPGEGWWQGTNVNPYPLLAAAGGGG